MNIFEDLIDELKEENLIEETVIQTGRSKKKLAQSESAPAETPELTEEVGKIAAVEAAPTSRFEKPTDFEAAPEKTPEPGRIESAKVESLRNEPADEVDFYRQRVMDEVAFLQMVESAFAGVERDQMKIVPAGYDDLEVKKVLHTYLQVSPKASASARSQAESLLLQATENWYLTLAERDKRIMTAHLRRYCETSRPPLSMPALIALARFYRNSPYSEAVRSKFDLMLTRIFSQEDYDNKREISFSRDELIGYIKELYAEWSSVPMYSTDADDEGIRQTVAQFEEFITEANAADNFDALINNNFFNRLRTFKESTNEDFYAPPAAAVSVELNVHIGNRYVVLLEREKEKDGIENVENKYGLTNDHTVSETMGKTMTLVELLKQKRIAPAEATQVSENAAPEPFVKPASKAVKAAAKNTELAKWMAAAVILFIIAVGVYLIFG